MTSQLPGGITSDVTTARETLQTIPERRRPSVELVAELPLRFVVSDIGYTAGVEVFLADTPVIAVAPGTRHPRKAIEYVAEALAKGLGELIRTADPSLRVYDPDGRFDDEERYYADPSNGLPSPS